jgi:hypothetical protein
MMMIAAIDHVPDTAPTPDEICARAEESEDSTIDLAGLRVFERLVAWAADAPTRAGKIRRIQYLAQFVKFPTLQPWRLGILAQISRSESYRLARSLKRLLR